MMTLLPGTIGSLAETLYYGNPNRNHKLWNTIWNEKLILQMNVLLFTKG